MSDVEKSARIETLARGCGDPALTVCIPTTDRLDLLVPCLDSLAATAVGHPVELLIGDTGSTRETTDVLRTLGLRTIRVPPPFNFSRVCNEMAHAARGEWLLFLNNDTEAVSNDWVDRVLSAKTTEVIGATLVYPRTERLQQAGIRAVSGGGWLRPNAYRPPRRYRVGQSVALENVGIGKRLDSLTTRRASVMAVTGAFLATTHVQFDALGGFDETFTADLQDVDYCLRARAHGMDVVCRHDIVFAHKHAASRGRYEFPVDDWRVFLTRWGRELERWKTVPAPI